MRTMTRRFGAISTIAAVSAASILVGAAPAQAVVPDLGQHVAVPAYIPPSDTASWASLTPSAAQLGFIVVNVANGPDSAVNAAWKTIIDTAHANGTKVLGYVDSGYFGATSPARETVLGDTSAVAWTVQAQQDIDNWYNFYGSSIDGIFIDDGLNTCGPTAGSNTYADLYHGLNDYIHSYHPGSLTVVNPGITVPQCYEDTADILVTYEGGRANYLSPPAGLETAQWQLDGDPNKFWEIVYDVSPAQLQSVIDKSKSNNAGYIYATEDLGANPYDTAPTGSYWTSELAATAAVSTTAPATASRPTADSIYSTGVDLSWTSSSASSVVGYEVYRGGVRIASVANAYPDDTEFTDVGLTQSTAYSYTVKARGLNGKLSAAASTARSVTTDSAWGNAPGAPGSLASSNLTANGVTLTWAASSVTNDPVAFYDVYVGGVRKLTLPPTVTSLPLGYLSPNTAYAITVKARNTSNKASAASSTLNITTPNPTAITSPAVTYGATTTTLQAQYNLTYNFRDVFIDTDNNVATGLQIGGIGADFLIQGTSFYQHANGTNTWAWNPITLGTGPLVSHTGGLYLWQVPSSSFSPSTTLRVVFHGSGTSAEYVTSVVTANK